MNINPNEATLIGSTPEEERHEQLIKALGMIAQQCFETCQAVKIFSNMVADLSGLAEGSSDDKNSKN